MTKAGTRILAAIHEATAFANGENTGAILHAPPDVRAIRQRLGMTQAGFAARFGLAVGNVRDWEQSRSAPDGAARTLLRVIEREPEAVARALETVA